MRCVVLLLLLVLVQGNIFRRNAVTDPTRLWPNGQVPYTFHSQIDAYRKVHLLAGMKQIMLSTYSGSSPCVTFVPRTSETDYIEIRFADTSNAGSAIGRTGGKQIMTIDKKITQDSIVRGLMFILGIHPEVARPDRDHFLEIVTGNIDAAFANSIRKESASNAFRQSFDYDTVVMYGPYAGAIDHSTPSIKTLYDGYTIGQAVSMSIGDVNLVQNIYKCPLDATHRVDVLGQLLFECHFHSDLCQFQQDNQDDFNWNIQEGQTSTPGTGPNADHSSGSGNYALAVASGHHNKVARLITPNFSAGEYCFVTWLYLYGSDIGQLRVVQRNVDGDKVVVSVTGSTPVNQWYHTSATIRSLNSQVLLRVEAIIGEGDEGDIAIDDVYIYKGPCIDWF